MTKDTMGGWAKALKKELDKKVQETNRMTLTEFQQFLPIFRKESPEISDDQRADLGQIWATRISQYHPVVVVHDIPNEDGDHVPVFTLPAVYQAIHSLNTVNTGEHDVVVAFSNAISRNNQLSTDIARTGDLIRQTVNAAAKINRESTKADIAAYVAIVRNLEQHLAQPESEAGSNDGNEDNFSSNDMEWD